MLFIKHKIYNFEI